MTALSEPRPEAAAGGLAKALTDGAIVAKRNLIKIKRVPDLLVFTTLSPIMFVLLFAYVFGSAIPIQGVNYREFLMAGIFGLALSFSSTRTAVSVATDMQKGLIDRFRSLPMSRAAVLAGRTLADVVTNALSVVILTVTGLIVGFSFQTVGVPPMCTVAVERPDAICLASVSAWLIGIA